MRLIDADAFWKDLELAPDEWAKGRTVKAHLNEAPTIDAEPVRHGRWVDLGWAGDSSWEIDGRGACWHVYECSECSARNCGGPKTNYCPKCGAKMDAKDINVPSKATDGEKT